MSSSDLNQHDDAGAEPDFPYSMERLLEPAETASPNLLWFGNDMMAPALPVGLHIYAPLSSATAQCYVRALPPPYVSMLAKSHQEARFCGLLPLVDYAEKYLQVRISAIINHPLSSEQVADEVAK